MYYFYALYTIFPDYSGKKNKVKTKDSILLLTFLKVFFSFYTFMHEN